MNSLHVFSNMGFSGDDFRGRASQFPVCLKPRSRGLEVIVTGRRAKTGFNVRKIVSLMP